MEVVGSNLWRSYEDAIFASVGRFTTTVEEEGDVSVLFSFSSVELSQALACDVFAESIVHIFLGEEDVYVLERSIVWSHAVELDARNSLHACFWHILLRQYDGQFLSAVVAVVEEDHYVAFLDSAVHCSVVDREDEFVSHVSIVAFLHSLYHVCSLLTLAFDEQIVCFLHTFPSLVTVHCVEATYDRSDVCTVSLAYALQLFDETLTALGVSVATVHEAVYEGTFLYAVFLSYFYQFEEVIQRRVYATV